MNTRGLRIVCMVIASAVAAYWFIPPLIHLGYRATTDEVERMAKQNQYFLLANAEAALRDQKSLIESRRKREELYYWFHARGWSIDEGDETVRFGHKWIELARYWKTK